MRLLSRGSGRAAPAAAAPKMRSRRAWRLRRRLLFAGAGAAAMLALAGGGFWLERTGVLGAAFTVAHHRVAIAAASAGLAVANVEVEGRERASREAILEALQVTRGTPILDIDPDAAKARLEALSWVRSAAVERRLPDTIHVRLVEREPLAFWQRNGKLVLIDREGAVVPAERLDQFGALLVLVGDDAPRQGAALLALLASEPALQRHVVAAVRVGGRRWNLRLDNGIDVELPEDDPAGAWHRLAALERSDGILQRNIVAVDLRLPDRLVVRMVPAPPKPPAKKGRQAGKST